MKLQVSSYNNGGATWNAEAEETALRSYILEHNFNRPAEAQITLADPTGAIAQKYNVDANDVYIGPSKITIEDPDATDIFYGRIVRVDADSDKRTVVLHCKDWLDQLDEELIVYDMREDLNGSGLRQSNLKSVVEDEAAPVYTLAGPLYFCADEDMAWLKDQFNGMGLFFTVGHAGDIIVSVGPFADTSFSASGVDTETGDYTDVWEEDGNVHTMEEDDSAFTVDYDFHINAKTGSLFSAGPTKGFIHLYARVSTVAVRSDLACTVKIKHADEGYHTIFQWLFSNQSTDAVHRLIEIPTNLLADFEDTDGTCTVQFVVDAEVAKNSNLDIYHLELELHYTMNGTSAKIPITDTNLANKNMDGAKLDDGGVFTDYITEMTSPDVSDGTVVLQPDPYAQADAFYFGFNTKAGGIHLNITTAGDYDGTISWRYYDGDSWESLSGVVDDTNGFKTLGANDVTWTVPGDWAEVAVDGETMYWVRGVPTNALPQIVTQAIALQGWAKYYCVLKVSTDVDYTGLGLVEGAPYCIAEELYKRLDTAEGGTLISDGDTIVALTAAATIEHTSGISTRQYIERTRLSIMQDLAIQDKAMFWMDLATTIVNWKSTFNDGAPTAINIDTIDAFRSRFDYSTMFNDYHVYGARLGGKEVHTDTDDAPSVAKYRASRSKAIRNSGLVSEYDTVQVGTSLVGRDSEVRQMLDCTISGRDDTYRLATEVAVTSARLGLTAENYIVSRWVYDSAAYKSNITLHPRVSTTGLQEINTPMNEQREITNVVNTTKSDSFIPDPITHEVP